MKKTLLLASFTLLSLVTKAQTIKDIDSLLKVVLTEKDTFKVKTLIKIANMYNRKGMPDSALHFATQAVVVAKNYGKIPLICTALGSLGSTRIRLLKFDEALEDFFTILKICNEPGCVKNVNKAKADIGYIYMTQHRQKEALRFFLEAEDAAKKINDTIELITIYCSLTSCYGQIGDTAKALALFQKAINMADIQAHSGNLPKAKEEFLMNLEIVLMNNTIAFWTSKEDLAFALSKLEALKVQAEAGQNRYMKFEVYCIMAKLSSKLKEYKTAQDYGEKALKTYNGEGNYDQLRDTYSAIAVSSASLNQFEKAYNNMLLYSQYNDSVFKFSKLEAINSVEAKYQVEKKEQEITTLNNEKKTQKIIVALAIGSLLFVLGLLAFVFRSKNLQKKLFAKEKEIKGKENKEKMAELEQTALRAQMNPHFIFNCLNSVQRFIISNDSEGANEYLSTFANLIRQTLENSGRKLIPLKDELRYLETYIKMEQLRSNNKFDYQITISPEIDQPETYIPNMIVQPYVENSIHHGMLHGNGAKGLIKLDISQNNKLNFVIDDNGTGIKNKNVIQLNGDNHYSMGGAITEKRIAMYNSLHEDKIELEILNIADTGSPDSGTRIVLKFPLNN
jgi:tetratricopeptide (TPR) repeat protein